MKNKPTEKQNEVLNIKNESVIVSASAGSGKTTIMIEKVLRLIRDDNIDVKNILVITFTNAAASEMKQKLINEINEAIAHESEKAKRAWLISQAEKVESANICTIDKFCKTLVKKYFYNIGVDPSYQIMSAESGQILKDRVFEKLLSDELKQNKEIFNLCDMLSKKRTTAMLKEIVFNFCDFLLVQEDMEKFGKEIATSCYALPLEENECYKFILNFINQQNEKISSLLKVAADFSCNNEKLNSAVVEFTAAFNNVKNVNDKKCRELLFDGDFSSLVKATRSNKKMSDDDLYALKKFNAAKALFKKNVPEYKLLLVSTDEEELEEELNRASYMVSLLVDFSLKFLNRLGKEKKKLNQFEFSDITHFAIEVLKNEDIHNDVLEEIKCVFVDEFQDVNEIQYKLINRLSREDNLFLVGDVKQSIYGFRLCDPEIFLEIYNDYKLNEKYKKAKDLNENFRSDRSILEFVNDVFVPTMTKENCGFEYADGNKLVPRWDFKSDERLKKVSVVAIGSIAKKEKDTVDKESVEEDSEVLETEGKREVYSVEQAELCSDESVSIAAIEAEVICNKVEEFLKCKIYDKDTPRDVKCSDIAILFRGRNAVYNMVKEKLTRSGVNVVCQSNDDLTEELEIKYFNALLKVINNPFDDISLVTVLTFFTDVTFDELAEIKLNSEKTNYYEAVLESENEKVVSIVEKIDELRKLSKIKSAYELALLVDNEFGISPLLLALPNGVSRKENLDGLIASLASDGLSLYDYIYFIENSNGRKSKTASACEDGITLSTIHSSKGLEYPIVILAAAGKNINKKENEPIIYLKDKGVCAISFNQKTRRKKDTIAHSYASLVKRKDELSEELRLLYVALTRAKNHLCVVGDISKDALEKLTYNIFESQSYMKLILSSLPEDAQQSLIASGKYSSKWASYEIVEKSSIAVSSLKEEEFVVFGKPDDELTSEIDKYLKFKYAYSSSNAIQRKNTVTALNSVMQENIVEVDKKVNYKINSYKEENDALKASELGSIYHKILERADFSKINCEQDLECYLVDFTEQELADVNKKVVYDVIVKLKGFMGEKSILHKEKQFLLYAPYSELFEDSSVNDNILVQGVVDLIIENEDEVIIVDYKATKESRANVIKNRYKTQLKLYRKAVSEAFNKKCSATKIFSIFGGILIDVE